MTTEDIKILILSFYEGETTVEEEQELLRYFKNENVPEELSEDKELFLQLYQSEPVEIPENLESKLSVLIDTLAEKEEKKSIGKTKRFRTWISAAACIIILITSGIMLNNQNWKSTDILAQKKLYKGNVITDPDEIAIETQKALILLSKNFNKGEEQLFLISDNLNKANQLLEKQIKSINNHGINIRNQQNKNDKNNNSI